MSTFTSRPRAWLTNSGGTSLKMDYDEVENLTIFSANVRGIPIFNVFKKVSVAFILPKWTVINTESTLPHLDSDLQRRIVSVTAC